MYHAKGATFKEKIRNSLQSTIENDLSLQLDYQDSSPMELSALPEHEQ